MESEIYPPPPHTVAQLEIQRFTDLVQKPKGRRQEDFIIERRRERKEENGVSHIHHRLARLDYTCWPTSSTSVTGVTGSKIIVITTPRGKLSPNNNFRGEGNSLQKNKYLGGGEQGELRTYWSKGTIL